MDEYPVKEPRKQLSNAASAAAKERFVVFVVSAAFALAMGAMLAESILWYRSQISALLSNLHGDWQGGAILLALYSSFAKKQVALMIAAVLALLGLGLSLHAMKQATQAELAGGTGLKMSFASFSPGIAAFLSAALIVLVVVAKDDKFEASAAPAAETPQVVDSAKPETGRPSQ